MGKEWKIQFSLLKELSDSSFNGIVKYMKLIQHTKKDFLFLENDAVSDIYFILSGKVRLTKSDNHGKEITLGYRKTGDWLTCGIFFNEDKSQYFVTGQMLEAGELLALSLETFEKVLKNTPEFAMKILQLNQNRMLDFTNTIRNLAFLDKNKALAVELIRLADQHGVSMDEGIRINLRLSHQEIANKIASSREFVSRTISMLSKQKIIKTGHNTITILNQATLSQMAE